MEKGRGLTCRQLIQRHALLGEHHGGDPEPPDDPRMHIAACTCEGSQLSSKSQYTGHSALNPAVAALPHHYGMENTSTDHKLGYRSFICWLQK